MTPNGTKAELLNNYETSSTPFVPRSTSRTVSRAPYNPNPKHNGPLTEHRAGGGGGEVREWERGAEEATTEDGA
jgi:hypothetical protein